MRILALVLSIILAEVAARANQTTASTSRSFEVASIKTHMPDPSGRISISMGGPDVSHFRAMNVTARMLIQFAYDIEDFEFAGGPSWINSEKFDVEAKVEDSLVEQLRRLPHLEQQQQMRLMLQSLLANRFALKITHGAKDIPIFALVVAKGGTKLIPITSRYSLMDARSDLPRAAQAKAKPE